MAWAVPFLFSEGRVILTAQKFVRIVWGRVQQVTSLTFPNGDEQDANMEAITQEFETMPTRYYVMFALLIYIAVKVSN